MTLWNDMIIGICLLLLGWLVWKESRRTNRLRLTARIVASVVAVSSLACLALPLSYWKKPSEASSGKEGVLLTEGYDPDSLRQFLQAAQEGGAGVVSGNLNLFSVADGSSLQEVAADRTLTDIKTNQRTIAESAAFQSLSKLHVFGYGLTRKQWASLSLPSLVFHPSLPPTGILSISWKQKIIAGEKLRIQGSVSLPPDRPAKLLLTGMGMSLDSVVIGPGTRGKNASIPEGSRDKNASRPDSSRAFAAAGQIDFELNTIPAQSGRSVYRLWVLSGGDAGTSTGGSIRMDTVAQESIPIEVLPARKLRILLLAASPDFENTFLVNWLARNGHAVATRTLISKDKSAKAFLNMPQVALEPLTAAVLDKFDLVIADAAILQSAKSAEGAMLRRQIAEKGLGLIIKADSLAASPTGADNSAGQAGAAFYKELFLVETTRDSSQRLYIKERPGTQPLLRDSASRILVSRGLYGSGKLVFTTLNGTYSRMLAGARKDYIAYWSLVLENAARDAEPEEDWQFTPDLPQVNEPAAALLQTNRSGLPQGQFGSIDNRTASGNATPSALAVYLAQSPLKPFQWQGTYWPASAGWQSAATLEGETFWWYAWSAEDWRSLHRRQRWAETKAYIADQAAAAQRTDTQAETAERTNLPSPASTGTSNPATHPDSVRTTPIGPNPASIPENTDRQRVPVPPAWFYALFLLSCLFLWVERKI